MPFYTGKICPEGAVAAVLYRRADLWQPCRMAEKNPASRRFRSVGAPLPACVHLRLADGTDLTARVKISSRARRTRLSLSPYGQLTITTPEGMPLSLLEQTLPQFLPWLERAWKKRKATAPRQQLPSSIELPLAGLTFAVRTEGDMAAGRLAAARHHENHFSLLARQGSQRLLLVQSPDCLRLFGAVEDASLCVKALRQWCRHMAEALLPAYLTALALQTGFALEKISVRDQRSRWGSCARTRRGKGAASGRSQPQKNGRPRAQDGTAHDASLPVQGRAGRLAAKLFGLFTTRAENHDGRQVGLLPADQEYSPAGQQAPPIGRISLNWRAALLPLPLLEHLCWHELCHLRHMDHSPAYRAELARYSPHWPEQEKALNDAWRDLPWWALPGEGDPDPAESEED
ncbi:YgjP-like metallopeptidase domain-containing protein [Desulfovibrio sp. 86]|uniref:YgjP-like metallopeptidase domain-containing protein n=1 Tax=uncultured Desulfovibrio sp. TaxID=167968 RepID=A0A212L1X0_9BACT|nr:YgjP-like metallopeptidase domain-containing protein [Desulfovibrio sp. 86]SCM71545.1 conserved hypothetical protein [uncultured Desulfovibrio sp.]VZH32941.1 conserved protein of unknown function [Desulfovibrio sp. 86]